MSLLAACPAGSVVEAMARPAVPAPPVQLDIFGRVLVTLRAVRLERVFVGAVTQRIPLILGAGSVLKIDQPVIQGVAVQVTNVLALFGEPEECSQDQLMDVPGLPVTLPVIERDALVPMPVQDRLQNPTTCALKADHTTVVANRILGVPLKGEPSFHGYECNPCTPVTGGLDAC